MSAIQAFWFGGGRVRAVAAADGTPLFILADVCHVLDIANPSNVVRRLEADDLHTVEVIDSMGRKQQARAVTESGVIDVTLDSRKPDARRFRRWLTHDVVPQIMQTGSYGTPALTGPQLMAAALIEAQATLAAKDRQIEAMAPAAEAWTNLASTDGDHSLRDAAQILDRDPRISTGQNRLGAYLREIGWVDRKGIPYQRHVDLGRIRSRIRYYDNPRTGERTLADPQIRLTAKGVETLRSLMAAGSEVAQ